MPNHGVPTNADLMRRLDEIAGAVTQHEKRLTSLEADRAVVHRLADHLREVSGEVRVIHDLMSRQDEIVSNSLRMAGRELASQVTATVRAELSGLRDEVKELREAVQARPCLIGECPVEGDANA